MKECGAAVCGGGGRRGGAATAPIAQQTALDYECMTGRGGGEGGVRCLELRAFCTTVLLGVCVKMYIFIPTTK